MKILKLIFGKSTDNNLSPDDIKNIKTLITHLNAIVDFLSSQKELPDNIVNKFKAARQAISRILNFSGLEIYFKRHITTNELNSLLIIIELSNEILKMGAQQSAFLSGKEHVAQIENLIREITRNYIRWVKN